MNRFWGYSWMSFFVLFSISVAAFGATDQFQFEQVIDHNHPALGTFKQRYYINSDYVTLPDKRLAPVIFHACHELACAPNVFEKQKLIQYAKDLGAHLIAFEHRYYGESQPFSDLSTENLRFLTTDQVMEDLANFARFAQQSLLFRGNWIVEGRSYGATLAAFFRLKHPELVVGALASSAPVRAKVNFEEYDFHVSSVLSEECRARVKSWLDQLDAMVVGTELDELKKSFGAAKLSDPVDFLYNMADILAGIIQYGKKQAFCSELVASKVGSETEVFLKFANDDIGNTIEANSKPLERDLDPTHNLDGSRQWTYQTCREYGFWQVAHHDPKVRVRSEKISLDYFKNYCRRVFGTLIEDQSELINSTYYQPLLEGKTSRIFFLNGSDDPWMELSISNELENVPPATEIFAYTIQGAAHCPDRCEATDSDSESLRTGRALVTEAMRSWFSLPGSSVEGL